MPIRRRPGSAARVPAAGAQRVLVVDDEPQLRDLFQRLLEAEGLQVVTARDGETALWLVREQPPDLVLLDIVLPGRSGVDVCAAIKQNPRTRLVPVILVTGLEGTRERVRGIEVGADDFLTKPMDRATLLARVRSLLKLKEYTDELEHAETVLFALARSIEARDPYTDGHCERLSHLASALGQTLGVGDDQFVALRRAGVLHDIGKVAVPDAILLKPGPLTAEEWRVMRTHAEAGERICKELKSLRHVTPVIRHHHERWDGSGYPDGLRGEDIPLTARILQVTDVYDALTTDRPYRPALSQEQALRTLDQEVRRGWWDAGVVAALKAMLRTRPRVSHRRAGPRPAGAHSGPPASR